MSERPRHVIVYSRDGRTTVVTGWRAWLIGIGGMLIAWLVLAVVAFTLVGVAISVGIALLLLIPAVAIIALIATVLGRRS